ncbi:unnamed protein product [Trichogramma brassicae]|uniref:Uncharacterized protein n=1 Tax=Trichogramma brassicae TaxID=86971 RepID=A0A6H5ITH9_9HYME|nr:unnamed protein product [Trichogramma brassicae]
MKLHRQRGPLPGGDRSENHTHKMALGIDGAVLMFLMSLSRHLNKIKNGSSYQKMIYEHHRYATMAYCEKLKIDDSLVELQSGSMVVITNIVIGNISATKYKQFASVKSYFEALDGGAATRCARGQGVEWEGEARAFDLSPSVESLAFIGGQPAIKPDKRSGDSHLIQVLPQTRIFSLCEHKQQQSA